MGKERLSPAADPTRRFLRDITILVAIAMLVATGGVYWRTSTLIGTSALEQARSYVDLIVSTRSWNAVHGGVWVAKGPGAETNPYLKELGISADATTTDGQVLTLRNPALMTGEISALLDRTDGTSFRLTSMKPVNPTNAPDRWEREALTAFAAGEQERWGTVDTTAGPALRYMRPLVTETSCLRCHERQGYRVGDVRGAISVIVSLGRATGQATINAILVAILGLVATIVMLVVTLTLVGRLRTELTRTRAALVEAATIDQLTGVATRRSTIDRLREEIERALRSGEPLAIIMADVDHFKEVNDTLGHAAGDLVLASVAGRVAAAMRPYDLLGRIGGEEFLIVAPAVDIEGAAAIAERARAQVSDSPVGDGAEAVAITASFGVTLVDPHEPDALDRALARADIALYEAKDAGRNRVSVRLPT